MHNFKAPKRASATAVSASIDDDRLPGRPNHKFVYAHSPTSWEYDAELGYLPRLSKIPLRPGINGCRRGRNGHLPVLSKLRAEGWTIIDENGPVKRCNDAGEVVDDTGYLMAWEGRKGTIYADVWSTPSVYGNTIDWASQYDREGFRHYRAFLRDSGAIPKAAPGVLAHIVKVQTRRANRRVAEGHDGNPHIQKHVKREMGKLENMQTDAAELGVKVKGAKPKERGPGRPRKVKADE